MVVHRGIVVVHGVGDGNKGAFLDLFVEPLARFIGDAIDDRNVIVDAQNEPSVASASVATLRLRDPDAQTVVEEWHIREAWWTHTFAASSAQSVLYWGIIGGLTALWMTFRNIFVRNALRFAVPRRYEQMPLARTDLRGRPLGAADSRRIREEDEGVWTVAGASRIKALLDAFVWLLITAGYLAVAIAGLLIIVPVYLLLLTPLTALFPRLGVIQRRIVGVLVRGVGDQQAMTTRRFALASASNEVSRALRPMLLPSALAERHANEPEFTGYQTVTVVAYSGGAVVAYDALATHVAEWMSRPMPPGLHRPARVNWITAGSGLNLAFRMRRRKSAQDNAFWGRRIDGYVNWLNIYARYDPIPQGPAPAALVEALVGPDPWLSVPADRARTRPPYVCLRVVNDDFPATDHFGYWRNGDEVMARVVHMVLSDGLSTGSLDPQRVEFSPSAFAGLRDQIAARTGRGRAHRTAVLRRQLPLYLGLLAFIAALPWASNPGRWLLGIDKLFGMSAISVRGRVLDDLIPRAIGSVSIEAYRDWLVGAAGMAFAALVAVQLLGLVFELVRWVRQGGSFWLAAVPILATGLTAALVVYAIVAAG
ncbi:MAG: hypothetical protein WEB13_09605 [Dehalococcoidia bacterium]